jgi:hypothetical protein
VAKSIPFAKLVRAAVKQTLPKYRFESTSGGSGPIVFYRAPTTNKRLAQSVFFQKGLYNTWLRANFAMSFVDKKRGEHALELAGDSLPDVTYTSEAELVAALAKLLPAVDRAAAAQAKAAAKLVPALSKLLDALPAHLATWMKQGGGELAPADFDEDSFAEPAFEQFKLWLGKQKLLVSAGELAIWHWWTDHHPKPKRKR